MAIDEVTISPALAGGRGGDPNSSQQWEDL
jgi:hypothetical protein